MAPKRPASSPMRLRGAKSARPSTSGKQIPDMKIDGILKEAGETPRRIQPTNGTSKIEGFRDKHPRVQFSDSKGLVNDGNNCYRNAVLQALFHIPVFVRYITFHKDCVTRTNDCVVCRLQELCWVYWFKEGVAEPEVEAEDGADDDDDEEEHRSVDPDICRRFHVAMEMEKNKPDNLHELRNATQNGGQQADAAGFLEYLIREQIQRKQSPDDDIPYQDMFEIGLKESWTCHDCGHEHTKSLENAGLGLPVSCVQPGMAMGRGLSWGMRQSFVDQRELRCYNSTACIEAGKDALFGEDLPGAVRDFNYTIVRAPEILFIAVGCFDTQPDNTGSWVQKKIKDRFNYPEHLDLGQHAEPGVTDTFRYRLDSVIAHNGEQIQFGHYIAAVREWNSSDSFHIADDDRKICTHRDGKIREAQRPTSFGSEAQAQFLLYSKIH